MKRSLPLINVITVLIESYCEDGEKKRFLSR